MRSKQKKSESHLNFGVYNQIINKMTDRNRTENTFNQLTE